MIEIPPSDTTQYLVTVDHVPADGETLIWDGTSGKFITANLEQEIKTIVESATLVVDSVDAGTQSTSGTCPPTTQYCPCCGQAQDTV